MILFWHLDPEAVEGILGIRLPLTSSEAWKPEAWLDAKGIEECPQDDTHGWCPVISLGTGHQDHVRGARKQLPHCLHRRGVPEDLLHRCSPQTVAFASPIIIMGTLPVREVQNILCCKHSSQCYCFFL